MALLFIRVVKLPTQPIICPFFWPCPSNPSFCSLFSPFPPRLTFFEVYQVRTFSDRIFGNLQKWSSRFRFENEPKKQIEFLPLFSPYFAPSEKFKCLATLFLLINWLLIHYLHSSQLLCTNWELSLKQLKAVISLIQVLSDAPILCWQGQRVRAPSNREDCWVEENTGKLF